MADAKRGHPDVSLRGYAGERGLLFLDRVTPAGYRAAVPADPELQANVVLGTLPGGEHGVLAHEAFALPCFNGSIAWSGTFHGVRVSSGGRPRIRDVVLGALPVVGDLVGSSEGGDSPALAPCTVAAVRLPESVGIQPRLRIDRVRKAPPFDFGNRTELDALGLPGWSMQGDPAPDTGFVRDVLADPVGELVRGHAGEGLFQIVVWWGTLVVRRNGYLGEPDELDDLGQAASAIARSLRAACIARHDPQPFGQPLRAPVPAAGSGLPAGYGPEPPWPLWGMELARRYGLTPEDPAAYHRAFPTAAPPGVARLVLRGPLPQLGVDGRLAIHAEPHGARAAVLFGAPAGTEPTPQGGVPLSDRKVYYDVRDGIVCVWCLPSYWGGDALLRDLDAFVATAADVVRERATGSRSR